MSQQVSIGIWNDRDRPHVVWIEPWAEDFTMLPSQKLIVSTIVTEPQDTPLFALVETEGNTQCYVECGDYPQVTIDGEPVECGHNRQVAIDVGLYSD